MKEKIDLLVSLGITKRRIANELGVSECAIRRYSIGQARERLLDDFLIEIQNKIIKILMEENE